MKKSIFTVALMLGFAAGAVPAHADSFGLDAVVSGEAPAGDPPWAIADLANMGGSTSLTMTARFSGNEFIGSWYFDLVPGLTLSADDFSFVDTSGVTGAIDVKFLNPQSAQNRAGVAGLDFYFDFPNTPGARFDDNDWVKFAIAGVAPSDFINSLAHTQNGSGWIGVGNNDGGNSAPPVPEPATMLLVGAGLGLAGLRKKMSK